MSLVKQVRILGLTAAVCSASALAVMAQTSPPASEPSTPPAATQPQTTTPATPPAAKPAEPTRPSATPTPDKSAAAKPAANALVGIPVFSSDGSKMGSVLSVKLDTNGKVQGIHIKTGGFLGFGGKIVEIPDGKFTKSGDNIQLGMTSDEVSKLPEVKDQS
jgi:sporulation protein YlmC with PRC-barrel domain